MAFKIVFRFREHREERMLLGSRVTVGRDPANDIVIEDPGRSLSRFHARLDFDGRYWRIVDTRSTNRVRVNGELIEPDEAGAQVLADGDAILLGGFEVRFLREAVDSVVLEDGAPHAGSVTLQTPIRLEDLSGLIAAPPAMQLPREAEEAIERARKALAVLGAVGGRIAAVTPVDDIIDTIVDLVFEATPAERAALFLWDEEAGRLVPKRTRMRSSDEAVTMEVSQSLVEQALAENAVVQIDAGTGLSASMHSLRLRSAIAVPLADKSRVIGVIYADTSLLTGAFDAFGVALLSALASHTAIALEQTRLLRKNRQEERWRMRLVQYLAPPVVDRILSGGSSPNWGMRAEEIEVTVLFCDMAGFTARTESMEPHDVLVLLNRCFGRMTEVVQEQGGTVDKYGRLPASARDLVDTDDLVQVTLSRVVHHVASFEDRGRGAFHAYLRQSLLNELRNQVRRARRHPAPAELGEQERDRGPSPLDEAVGRETLERYEAALLRLDPDEREAVIGRVELGLSHAELAEALGKSSPDAARMAVARALVRLTREMSG